MNVFPQPRARVLDMPEYHPPLAGRDALRLDFNENTLAPSPHVLAKLRELTAEGLTIYPEREPVERIVAGRLGHLHGGGVVGRQRAEGDAAHALAVQAEPRQLALRSTA